MAELVPAGNGFRNGEDMMDTMTDTALKVIERTMDLCPIDNLFVHEDMAGKSGPLIGPNQISQFIAPYYSRVWEAARAGGAQLFSQDSDGNMNSVLDCFKAAGVQCFYPAEPAAGMDIVQMKRKYGKELYYKGGIDKHTLRKDKEAIRRELEHKLCPEPGISPAATEKGWTLQPAAKTGCASSPKTEVWRQWLPVPALSSLSGASGIGAVAAAQTAAAVVIRRENQNWTDRQRASRR